MHPTPSNTFTRLLVVVMLALGAILSVSAGVPAGEPSDVAQNLGRADPEGADLDLPDLAPAAIGGALSPAELEDLGTVAESHGWTLDEAIARSGWHQSFAMLAEDLRLQYPREYAGAKIEPSGNPWIGFRGEAPAGAVAAIAEFEAKVFTADSPGGSAWSMQRVDVIQNRGFTEAELDERLVQAHFAAFAQKDLVAHVSSGYDIATGKLTVEIEPVASVRRLSPAALAADLVARSPHLNGVTVRIVDDLGIGGDANLFGGVAMSMGCTSGFTTIRGTLRGIATAGHCLNSPVSMSGVSLTYMAQHIGTWGDMQWHTAATHQDDFYSGSPTQTQVNLRDVTGVGSPVVGQELCKNGVTTHKTCDNVYLLNRCADGACHMAAMEERLAADGDSGGPVFWGNTAYGLHQGEETILFIARDDISLVTYMPNAFAGVYVLVNG